MFNVNVKKRVHELKEKRKQSAKHIKDNHEQYEF